MAARPVVIGCVRDADARASIHLALSDSVNVEWLQSFSEVRARLGAVKEPATLIVGASDGVERAPALAAMCRQAHPGTPVVVWCREDDSGLADLAVANAHGLLLGDLSDQTLVVRSVVLGASVSAAADLAVHAMTSRVPPQLAWFAEIAARYPRDLHRVEEVAERVHIPRQTLSRWCRELRFFHPEALMVWARLFVVVALLETTSWTVEGIAEEMAYGSATALRNRIRSYTGVTATELRSKGLSGLERAFDMELARVRAPESSGGEVQVGDAVALSS